MAFPTGWGRKCALTVPAAQISGTSHTDFPVLLTLANLPSEMFDSDGSYPALNGGGDIRFSSDSAGTTQLACEIVSFVTDANPANGSAEIWVKIPTLATNAGSGTTFYVWYNKSGETQPAVTDTYGRNAVWANYEQVVHGQDVSGSIVDSTGNYTGTVSGSVANAAGVFGWGQSFEFDGTAGEIGFGTLSLPSSNRECAIQALIRPASDPSGNQMIYGGMGGASTYAGVFMLADSSDYVSSNTDCLVVSFQSGNFARKATTSESVKASDTLAAVASFNNGVSSDDYSIYLNDSQEYNVTSGLSDFVDSGARTWEIGGSSGFATDYFDGRIQECRLKYSQIPQDWVLTEYNAANDPAAFVSDGTPESVGGGTNITTTVGSVEVTAVNAVIAKHKAIVATVGSVDVTGVNAVISTSSNVEIATTVGNVQIAGFNATLNKGVAVSASVGSVTVTGVNATIDTSTNVEVSVSVGSVQVSGVNAVIEISGLTQIITTVGSVAVTGTDAVINKVLPVSVSVGNIDVTGINATISKQKAVSVTVGSVEVSGVSATIVTPTVIVTGAGTVVVTGYDAVISGLLWTEVSAASTTWTPISDASTTWTEI